MRWDGQITLSKPLSEVSYLSDYEVGWANHTKKSRIQVTMRGMGKSLLEFSYSSDYEVGWADHT